MNIYIYDLSVHHELYLNMCIKNVYLFGRLFQKFSNHGELHIGEVL